MLNAKIFPDANQELLLKTILNDSSSIQDMWQLWNEKVDFDHLDYDTCCVIPTLYKTLVKYEINSPNLALMKGLSRKFWCKNQLLYSQLDRLLNLADNQNISIFAIRGTAINLAYYQELALRPVEEIDLFVDSKKIDNFKQFLVNNNWQEISPAPVNNTLRFLNPKNGVRLDIYQSILPTNLEENNDSNNPLLEDKLTSNLQTINFKNHQLKILTPENQLLQVSMQGHNPKYVSPYRWVMDAIQIITLTPKFDWSYFQQIQQQIQQKNSVLLMLDYLKNTFVINIPLFD